MGQAISNLKRALGVHCYKTGLLQSSIIVKLVKVWEINLKFVYLENLRQNLITFRISADVKKFRVAYVAMLI